MRNLKKILCLALVLSMVLAVVSGAAYTNYTDDAELTMVNEDYLLAAQLLQDIGVVVGVKNPEDGKTYYYPDQLLTRAELARVLYVLYSGTTDSAVYDPDLFRDELSTTFTDISGHWAEGYIKYGQAMGYLNGKSAEIFDPDATVKAQEMATALLIVLGYKAADLSPNYPVNVVKYGYTNNKGNLFTTGLSTAAASGGDHGMHIVGLGAAYGANEKDVEGEYQLERELTREEAFYMMYKAIALRSTVSKNLYIGNAVANVDGTYYYATGKLYVDKFFAAGKGFKQESKKDIVAGTENYAFTGANNDAGIYTGNYGKDGYVYLHNNGLVRDFGYTAKQGAAQGSDQGYGFILSATDWDKQLGREITFTLTTWGNKKFITEYAFSYGTGETTEMRSFSGSTVEITKETAISVDGTKLVVGDKKYEAHADGINWIYNEGVGTELAGVDALAEEIADVQNKNSTDKVKLYIVDKKIYGVIENERFFGEVTSVDEDDDKVEWATISIAGDEFTIKNTYKFAKGDHFIGYFNEKTLHEANAAVAAETIETKYDGMTLVYEKVAPTVIENVVVVDKAVTTAAGTVTTKHFFIEKADGVEFKIGAYSSFLDASEYYLETIDAADFERHEDAYWALYIVDGYALKAVKTMKNLYKDLVVTAKKVDVNTSNNTVVYTFTMKDAKDNVYTYTKTSTEGYVTKYDNIAVGATVSYKYDAKTLAAIGITEFKTRVAETVEIRAGINDDKDTVVAKFSSVAAAYNEAKAEPDVIYRIVLPESNTIIGSVSQLALVGGSFGGLSNVKMNQCNIIFQATAY